MKNDTIQSCLMAQHDDQDVVDEIRSEIEERFNEIANGDGDYGDLEELMLEHGIDGEGIEDLLFAF